MAAAKSPPHWGNVNFPPCRFIDLLPKILPADQNLRVLKIPARCTSPDVYRISTNALLSVRQATTSTACHAISPPSLWVTESFVGPLGVAAQNRVAIHSAYLPYLRPRAADRADRRSQNARPIAGVLPVLSLALARGWPRIGAAPIRAGGGRVRRLAAVLRVVVGQLMHDSPARHCRRQEG